MSKLFIIGNGFDLAHGIKSSYQNFKEFLLEKYPEATGEFLEPLSENMMPDGALDYDAKEVVNFIVYLINAAENYGELWQNLEESLGRLDYGELFDYVELPIDEDGDTDYWQLSSMNSEIANGILPIIKVKDYFSDWVDAIDLNTAKGKKTIKKLFIGNCLFLTFNYTETLEKIYGRKPKNICHIHGKAGSDIYFGHGDQNNYDEYYMRDNIGSEDVLSEIDAKLRKNTEKAYRNNLNFFNKINNSNITEIYSYGFSFSKVDQFYLDQIISGILDTTEVTWYLNNYDSKEVRKKYKKILEKHGFHGTVATFTA